MKFQLFSIVLIACFACEQTPVKVPEKESKKPSESKIENSNQRGTNNVHPVKKESSVFQARYYYADSLGWGYDILKGNSVLIHQPHIPAIQGNQGFKSEYDAEKAANRVIEKLDRNIMPPTLSVDELRELGVL